MSEEKQASLLEYIVNNPESFAQNMAKVVEGTGKAIAAYTNSKNSDELKKNLDEEFSEIATTLSKVGQYWISDPQRVVELQSKLMSGYMDIWNNTLTKLSGHNDTDAVEVSDSDKRFKDEDWQKNQFFNFLKQMYLLTSEWAETFVNEADGIDDHTRHKAQFYVKQIINALSPSNYVLTNPQLLKETFSSNAGNLVKGMENLLEDLKAGNGELKIRQTDSSKFKVGENVATTPGKVIAQNDICQLIQYMPTTEKVLSLPLLIIPPWINKFYILDLNPQKSFIKWAIDQGHTVFVISWVNPDENLAEKSFENYIKEGILDSLKVIQSATGQTKVNTVGYCVGGTLLAATLAYLSAKNINKIASATFLTTQVDFKHAGDLKVFVDEEQVNSLEKTMAKKGYLDGKVMANVFNMLRSNDLVWPYVINNYLLGKEPFPFDLLFWNSDSTRLPAANHSFYIRNCYLENKLSQSKMIIDNVKLDLKKIKIPIYNLATKEDHIAPAKSVFWGSKFFGSEVKFVLSGSGHIAGVINPPDKEKYQFWTNGPAKGKFEDWQKGAKETNGSWWPNWNEWIYAQNDRQTNARFPGSKRKQIIEDAPGSFVKVMS